MYKDNYHHGRGKDVNNGTVRDGIWNNDQIVVRSNAGSTETEVEDILTLDCYSGGTGIAFTLDRVEVFNLKTGEAYGQFQGSAAKAGRFTSSGAPVVVINQGNTVVCYQL